MIRCSIGGERKLISSPLATFCCLEVKAYLHRQRPRTHIMRAAEGGKEVVERVFVGDVDGSKLRAPFKAVAVEEIVVADRDVEQITRRDPRRVFVVVLGVWCRYL